MTLVVYLLLPEFHDRLAGEFRPLLAAVAWAAALVAASSLAFLGELKAWPRRRPAQVGLAMLLVAFGWSYWPA
jgi:CHASE2 domain-containing sensor protein